MKVSPELLNKLLFIPRLQFDRKRDNLPKYNGKNNNERCSNDKNKELECPVCLEIFSEAVQISCCGNTFCQKCIEAIKNVDIRTSTCPVCRSALKNVQMVPDFKSQRLAKSVVQPCPRCKLFEGNYDALQSHLQLHTRYVDKMFTSSEVSKSESLLKTLIKIQKENLGFIEIYAHSGYKDLKIKRKFSNNGGTHTFWMTLGNYNVSCFMDRDKNGTKPIAYVTILHPEDSASNEQIWHIPPDPKRWANHTSLGTQNALTQSNFLKYRRNEYFLLAFTRKPLI